MEAVALYDFVASTADELSLRRGDRLLIVSAEQREGWWDGLKGNHSGIVPANYVRLEPNEWFRNDLCKSKAHELLLQRNSFRHQIYPDGVFVVRPSDKDRRAFCLTVKHKDGVMNFKILRNAQDEFLVWPNSPFPSINQLVQNYHVANLSTDPRETIYLREKPQEIFEAMFDFHPSTDDEIGLKRGDIIRVTVKGNDHWWDGEVNGKRGLFPGTYVQKYM